MPKKWCENRNNIAPNFFRNVLTDNLELFDFSNNFFPKILIRHLKNSSVFPTSIVQNFGKSSEDLIDFFYNLYRTFWNKNLMRSI